MYTQWLHERLDDSAKPRMWRELVNFQEEVSGESTRRPVSRTKLRGVIGLLKQAGVVCSVREADRADTDRDSQASDGDGSASSPTKVKLGYGVRTFDDVRVREDTKIKGAPCVDDVSEQVHDALTISVAGVGAVVCLVQIRLSSAASL